MLPIIDTCYNSSDHCIEEKLYIPCLEWATKFDRGVGYFTSGWLSHTAKGMASFAQRGGRARWLTSPILDEQDLFVFLQKRDEQQVGHMIMIKDNSICKDFLDILLSNW